jgi:putative SOS response-associated peptidase YedK
MLLVVMCGRYSLATSEFSEIQLEFSVEELQAGAPLAPRDNIAPTWSPGHEPPIVLVNSSGQRQLDLARWWLIPAYWKRPLKLLPTAFNARAEELSTKRFWSKSFEQRRCLVPVTGWREFTGPSGQRQPHHFHYDHALFGFAGVWDEWLSPAGDPVRSFAIVTVAANDVVTPIHDRMPLRVDPAAYDAWLDPDVTGEQALAAVREASAPPLSHHETDPAGNDVRREGPDVIAQRARKQLTLF